MNIALFTDSYIPTKSGIVTVVLQLRKVLTDMGHHVVIVTVNAHNYHDPEIDNDPDILRILSVPTPFKIPDQYIGFPFERIIIPFLKKHQIQIIHSHTEFFIAHAAKLSGKKLHIPVIATTHTLWEDFYIYYLPFGRLIPVKLIRKCVKRLYKKFFALINVSEKARDYFKSPFMLPASPSAIIPNALDSDSFIRKPVAAEELAALRKSWGIAPDDVVLLFLGRVVEEKRVEELLEVCMRVIQKNERLKVMFVGSGGALQDLEKRAREVSDRSIFTGYEPWTKVHYYYGIGDIFITASLSEMHSMTVLEALMSRLPIIARRDSSFSDTIFHGENGYFADTDEEMDGYILDLAADAEKRRRFGEKSYAVSRNFTPDVFGKRTIAFYTKVLEKYPERPTDRELQDAVDAASC